jgi:HEPN domain-containing protein
MTRRVTDNWISLAEYDLATAEAMLTSGRFLYVGFMRQQAIEKLMKASYVAHRASTPPYTHNLLRLAAELPWNTQLDVRMLEVLESLNSYYIESRYTEDIAELQAALTEEKATEILSRTKELFAWIRSRL